MPRLTPEVHILSNSSNYQSFSDHIATPRRSAAANSGWSYQLSDVDLDGIPDLWNSTSEQVEVHVLSGASNFQQSVLDVGTPIYSGATNAADFIFSMIDWDNDGIPDLVGIKIFNTGGTVELHILSGASHYQQWLTHIATTRPAPGLGSAWSYLMADVDQDGKPDLVGTLWNASSQQIEVHILSGGSNYQQQYLDVVTPMSSGALNAADLTFVMQDLDYDGKLDLVGIKMYNTGTSTVEIHALSGASNFQQWVTHTTTGFGSTPIPPNFAFAMGFQTATIGPSAPPVTANIAYPNYVGNPPPAGPGPPACNDLSGAWSDTTGGINNGPFPELQNAALLFGGGTPTVVQQLGIDVGGATCFVSPEMSQWKLIQSNLNNPAVTALEIPNLPGTHDPRCYTTLGLNHRQFVYKRSISSNALPSKSGAPAFIFERPKSTGEPAVVDIP